MVLSNSVKLNVPLVSLLRHGWQYNSHLVSPSCVPVLNSASLPPPSRISAEEKLKTVFPRTPVSIWFQFRVSWWEELAWNLKAEEKEKPFFHNQAYWQIRDLQKLPEEIMRITSLLLMVGGRVKEFSAILQQFLNNLYRIFRLGASSWGLQCLLPWSSVVPSLTLSFPPLLIVL